jgi:Fe-S-cluster containining protein
MSAVGPTPGGTPDRRQGDTARMAADRQQRRHRRRQLLRHGEAALKRGLPPLAHKDGILGTALMLADTLADAVRPNRASMAAETMLKVLEASVKSEPGQLALACRKGCAYCCHGWVSATAPELLLLASVITAEKAPPPERTRGAVLVRAARTRGLSIAERIGRKLPCPLLIDGTCSVYAARPVVCRQTTAIDVASCIAEYEGREAQGDIRVSRVYLDHARNCRIPLQAALSAQGLPAASYELSAGLEAALAPGAEARWLAGEDVFAGITTAPADPAPIAQAVDAIVAEVRALGGRAP